MACFSITLVDYSDISSVERVNCIVELEVTGVALIQSEGRVPVPLSIALNEKVRGLAAGSIVKDASVNV